jgi:hypothetical protein
VSACRSSRTPPRKPSSLRHHPGRRVDQLVGFDIAGRQQVVGDALREAGLASPEPERHHRAEVRVVHRPDQDIRSGPHQGLHEHPRPGVPGGAHPALQLAPPGHHRHLALEPQQYRVDVRGERGRGKAGLQRDRTADRAGRCDRALDVLG